MLIKCFIILETDISSTKSVLSIVGIVYYLLMQSKNKEVIMM